MANKNILTTNSKVTSVEQIYFSPSAVIPPQVDTPLSSIYCFLAKVDQWTNENDPPQPTQDDKSLKYLYKNMFVAKQITSGDISPVIPRVNWTTGVTYDYYKDDVDMLALDQNGYLIKNFYVKNRYDQVFKCLWNGGDVPASDEPYFEPGSYNTFNLYTGPNDGYKWKYIYTIDSGQKVKFMDTTWMPVAVGTNTPNPLNSTAGCGSIDAINVTFGGSGYSQSSLPAVTIVGDGTGASGTCVVDTDGVITDVTVTNPGTNYTYANVIFQSGTTTATGIAPVSPISGHGYDPISELGCNHVMFTSEFNGSENGYIPTDITYHQVGLLVNPTTNLLSPLAANAQIYSTTTDIVVAPGKYDYVYDEVVYQAPAGSTVDNSTFKGTVLSFDTTSNVLKLINTEGTITKNAPIRGNTSQASRTILTYNTPDFVLFSGYITYVENRTGIQRSEYGIEQIKIVLGY